MAKKNIDYTDWTKDDLVKEIKRIKETTYGLVWHRDVPQEKLDILINPDARTPEETFANEVGGKPFPVLKEVKTKTIITDEQKPVNILIEGDNYHSLAVLNFTHQEAIDVIYIDPPYNTGNKDFIYNDSYVDKEDTFRHSKWLSFMEKRLRLARNVLKQTGVIFLSIDDIEQAPLRMLCDEIFGENNFIGNTIRATNSAKNTSKFFSITHDYTLVYAKNKKELVSKSGSWKVKKSQLKEYLQRIKQMQKQKLSAEEIEKELKILTKYPRFYEFDHYYYIDDKFAELGPYASDKPGPSKGAKGRHDFSIPHPVTGKLCKKPSTGWGMSKEVAYEMLSQNRWHFGENENVIPRPKAYLSEHQYSKPTGIFFFDSQSDVKRLAKMDIAFDNPKPIDFLKQILSVFDSKIVALDFFAGSGSLGQAVLELNATDKGSRQFILCTNNENDICTGVTYPRLKKVIEGYKNTVGDDIPPIGGNMCYFTAYDFVESEPTDKNKRKLVKKSSEMLCIKEGVYDLVTETEEFKIFKNPQDKYLGIIFYEDAINAYKKELKKIKNKVTTYVFSLGDDPHRAEFTDVADKVELQPIPEVILRVYREIFK